MSEERFVDYYEILQVSPNADPDTIERVFRLLAKRYHPDNGRTGNPERFKELSDAFRVLSNPEERAGYDARYETGRREQWSEFFEAPLSGGEEDRRVQQWILSVLYRVRRRGASNPGIGGLELEDYLGLPEGHLEFHLWYLKEKGWIGLTDSGRYCITVDGVDWIADKDQLLRKDRLIEETTGNDSQQESSSTSEEEGESSIPGEPQPSPGEESAE